MKLEYAIIGVMIFLVSSVLGLIAYDPEFVIQSQSDKTDKPTTKSITSFQKVETKPVIEKVETSISEETVTTEKVEIQEEAIKEMPPIITAEPVISEPIKSAVEEPPLPTASTTEEEVSAVQVKVTIPGRAMYPGCDESRKCYIPSEVMVQSGNAVVWHNDDIAAHTVTSGNPADGPNGIFDSGLFLADETFSFTFDELGEYQYFCVVHPWMTGTVFVN